jgi:predicted enzyme related to lactoylglutathione lyase
MSVTGDSSDSRRETSVFRDGGVSYLRIPAPDPAPMAAFYRAVFGWTVREDPSHPAFTDGTGHVIGHFMSDVAVVGEAGVLPYIYVADLNLALASVTEHGGTIVDEPYPEGDLWVATARDPAGNFLGLWQRGQQT